VDAALAIGAVGLELLLPGGRVDHAAAHEQSAGVAGWSRFSGDIDGGGRR
jgi:hypothetical protein